MSIRVREEDGTVIVDVMTVESMQQMLTYAARAAANVTDYRLTQMTTNLTMMSMGADGDPLFSIRFSPVPENVAVLLPRKKNK